MKTIEIKVTVDATDPNQIKAINDLFAVIGGIKPTSKKTAKSEKENLKPEKEDDNVITIEEIRAVLTTKVDNYRSDIKAKLVELGAGNVSTLDKSKYAEFLEFLNGLE